MPRGGHNKKKTIPDSGPVALTVWPKPPVNFNASERASWARIGRAAIATGSVGSPDLVLAERLAQLDARVDEALSDPDLKVSTLSALLRLEADLLNRMGLTPQARSTVGALAKPKRDSSPLDEF